MELLLSNLFPSTTVYRRHLKPGQRWLNQTSGDSSVFNWLLFNIRFLPTHFVNIEALNNYLESPPKIICLTETWLSTDVKSMYTLKNYPIISHRQGKGGGIVIRIHNSVTIIKDSEVGLPEASGVIVEFEKQRALIVVIYVAPRVGNLEFVHDKERFLNA